MQVRLNATKRIEVDRLSRRTQSGKNKQSFKGREEKKGSQFYFFVTGFPFPLGPLLSRPTVRVEVHIYFSRTIFAWQSMFTVSLLRQYTVSAIKFSSTGPHQKLIKVPSVRLPTIIKNLSTSDKVRWDYTINLEGIRVRSDLLLWHCVIHESAI